MFTNVPNLLSLSRLPLAAVLFFCLDREFWIAGLIVFAIAAFTDWLDGWYARKFNCGTAIGRNLDPLTDKVLLGGAFIFLIRVPDSHVEPWIATVVVGREILITGLRGMIESTGKKFGADWFGKLKTTLQCAAVFAVLILKVFPEFPAGEVIYLVILYAMVLATVGSAANYCWKAAKLLD